MSEPKWRECDDPELLAAAVAAGVKVQCVAVDGRTWETGCDDSASFRRCMANDCRYRVPAVWSPAADALRDTDPGLIRHLSDMADRWGARGVMMTGAALWPDALPESPVPPWPPADDLRERIAQAIYEEAHEQPWKNANHPDWVQSLRSADAVLAVLPAPPDVAMHDGEPVEQWRYDALVAERDWLAARLEEADAERTKLRHKLVESAPPAPPWPGAVLSGLVDEDGQPTWLAQAGNVQGEQTRGGTDGKWKVNFYGSGAWVEVRAPRPAPATERVQAWEAVRDGRQVVGASSPFEAHYIWRSGPDRAFIGERTMDKAVLVAPDGTVEVLVEDGES